MPYDTRLFSYHVSFDELFLLRAQSVVQWHLTPADAEQREENAQVNHRADAVHGAECFDVGKVKLRI